MRFRNKSQTPDDEPAEANVLPVMNVMFLLIPALLLAMETASMAGIRVHAPRSSPAPSPTTTTQKDDIGLKVRVNQDAIVIEAQGHSFAPLAAIQRPDGSHSYDFAALEATAKELKAQVPQDARVRISAENDVEYQHIIAAMDALRGTDCKSHAAGETVPAECLFWAPTIDAY